MKNQYFDDVNDYRKYGLLRTLVRASGLRVGVCWFLTADDGGPDGERRQYLNQPRRWRHYDPELFDRLRRLSHVDVPRSVSLAREWELVPAASYFEALLHNRRSARTAYFAAARQAFEGCDLVFMDPDNGIEVQSTKLGAAGSSRYVYWSELKAVYEDGQSLLMYQQFPRVVRERFVPFLAARLGEELPGSNVVAFSTAHVVFFLVQQTKLAGVLETAARAVERQWRGQIEVWPAATTSRPNHAMEPSALPPS